MNLNDQLAKDIIRERTSSQQHLKRPSHPRAARVLRRLAERFDQTH